MTEKCSNNSVEASEGFNLKGSIFEHFQQLADPRIERTKKHKLLDIIFIAICAAICGANHWKAVTVYAQAKEEWLKSILELPNGIPSHVTFWRVFSRIKPEEFHQGFISWIKAIFQPEVGEIIAIDGKTMRGSANEHKELKALHMVSAWAATHNLTLAQLRVDKKSNEITAIPALLEMIDIKGATVTTDAMGCQKTIAKNITEKGADYILALKGNQESIHDEVRNYFEQALTIKFEGLSHDIFQTIEKGHGRIEARTVYVTNDIEWLPQKDLWSKIESIVMVISERETKKGYSKEIRYYLSSLAPKASKIAQGIRAHWGIENQVHWILDVHFEEDQNQLSDDCAENFGLLSKIALNLLKQEKQQKLSIDNKRFRAAMDNNYLLQILKTVI